MKKNLLFGASISLALFIFLSSRAAAEEKTPRSQAAAEVNKENVHLKNVPMSYLEKSGLMPAPFTKNELLLPYLQKADDVAAEVTGPFNSNGNLGKVSGRIYSVTMWQKGDSYNSNNSIKKNKYCSSTLSYLINYKTPEYADTFAGIQFLNVMKIFDGHHQPARSDAYYLNNDKCHLVNELYVDHTFKELGLEKTGMRAGRQIFEYEFFRKNMQRHKDQAAEAIALTMKDIPGTTVSVGQMRRFSSWGSRDEMPYPLDFTNLGDVVQVPYRTVGATFGQATYEGIPNLSVTGYDWLLYDLFNVAGWKAVYTIEAGEMRILPRAHFAWERSVGRMERDGLGKLTSYAMEFASEIKFRQFTIEPSVLLIDDNERSVVKSFQHPFDTTFAADQMKRDDWTRQFNAGAKTLTIRSTYQWRFFKTMVGYYYTFHSKSAVDGPTDRGSRDQQIETDLIFALTRNMSARLAFIYGERGADRNGRKNLDRTDTRLYFTYNY